MAGQSSIVHPKLLQTIKAVYPSQATIQQLTSQAPDAYGQPVETWANVPGLVQLAAQVIATIPSSEYRRSDRTVTVATHTVQLAAYLPSITTAMRLQVDGIVWNILDVDHDSQHTQTRLLVEKVGM